MDDTKVALDRGAELDKINEALDNLVEITSDDIPERKETISKELNFM
jgi:uncharacterized protein YPO0396